MRINEIFYSLQGEGYHTGNAAIFIRFAGCNLNCSFCDTEHTPYDVLSNKEIIDKIKGYRCKTVILTGGEPTLQITEEFIKLLHSEGFYVCMETNGTINKPFFKDIDFITCSPKNDYCKNAEIKIEHIDELKVVYTGEDVSHHLNTKAKHYYLQPCDTKDEIMNEKYKNDIVEYIKSNPIWKLSLQTQKILNVQ